MYENWEELEIAIKDCNKCKLCVGRKNIVFGVGNKNADIMFIGEGPGADEDAQGEPFVGKAGQLMNKAFEAAQRLQKESPELEEYPLLKAKISSMSDSEKQALLSRLKSDPEPLELLKKLSQK